MNRELKNIKQLHKIIVRSLFRINPPLSRGRILIAIGKLADMVNDYTGENDDIWDLSDDYPIGDILIGAYWYFANYHPGQWSLEYSTLSKIGRVYSPNFASGPEPDSVELETYQNLENF